MPPTTSTTASAANITNNGWPEAAITTVANRKVPMNSATEAASSGERLNVKRALRADALADAPDAARTVVTLVDVFLAFEAGFLAVFLDDPAGFLVAINISLLV